MDEGAEVKKLTCQTSENRSLVEASGERDGSGFRVVDGASSSDVQREVAEEEIPVGRAAAGDQDPVDSSAIWDRRRLVPPPQLEPQGRVIPPVPVGFVPFVASKLVSCAARGDVKRSSQQQRQTREPKLGRWWQLEPGERDASLGP